MNIAALKWIIKKIKKWENVEISIMKIFRKWSLHEINLCGQRS